MNISKKLSSHHKFWLLTAQAALLLNWLFPQHLALAATMADNDWPLIIKKFPTVAEKEPRYYLKVWVTAYSSTPDQTDSTPFVTASGDSVRDGIVAANWLPFGSLVKLPDHFGDKIFEVQDRMHERFSNRLDIWMSTREQARLWGVRYVSVAVY